MLIKGQCREAPPLACFYMTPRSVAPDRRVTPFFVYRIGSSFVNIEDVTLYEMMMLGLRIALTEKSALNLSCGLEMNFGAYWSGGYALHIGYEF